MTRRQSIGVLPPKVLLDSLSYLEGQGEMLASLHELIILGKESFMKAGQPRLLGEQDSWANAADSTGLGRLPR